MIIVTYILAPFSLRFASRSWNFLALRPLADGDARLLPSDKDFSGFLLIWIANLAFGEMFAYKIWKNIDPSMEPWKLAVGGLLSSPLSSLALLTALVGYPVSLMKLFLRQRP